MYEEAFCKVYNEFGWNYFPEAFGQQLLLWLRQNSLSPKNCLDLGCGTGVLCRVLQENGISSQGMDFSESMIALARQAHPHIPFEVGDMVTYAPAGCFDLVTCTGDAINHIPAFSDVERIFRNVYGYLAPGGHFVLDLLSRDEVPDNTPFDLDFSESVQAKFQVTRPAENRIQLSVQVFENGHFQFEETITEIIHDRTAICNALEKAGFTLVKCAHQLPDGDIPPVATWYIIAKK